MRPNYMRVNKTQGAAGALNAFNSEARLVLVQLWARQTIHQPSHTTPGKGKGSNQFIT